MKINVDQVFEDMKREETLVLNILPKVEFTKLHIKGSQNHPLKDDPETFSKEVEEKFGKEKHFIVHGERFGLLDSYLAAKSMEDRGLKVRNYSGGMREWFRKGLPVGGTQVEAVVEAAP